MHSNINQMYFIPGVGVSTSALLVSLHLLSSDFVSYTCLSCVTIFTCCQITRLLFALWPGGKTDFISLEESVCLLLLSQDSRGLPLTRLMAVPQDLTQPSQFSCAFVGCFPEISWPSRIGFVPPSSLSSLLLYLPDPSLDTLAPYLGVSLEAPSCSQCRKYHIICS